MKHPDWVIEKANDAAHEVAKANRTPHTLTYTKNIFDQPLGFCCDQCDLIMSYGAVVRAGDPFALHTYTGLDFAGLTCRAGVKVEAPT